MLPYYIFFSKISFLSENFCMVFGWFLPFKDPDGIKVPDPQFTTKNMFAEERVSWYEGDCQHQQTQQGHSQH